jgi:hypothetical protein
MIQEDALAVAQNGGISSSDEGELDGDDDLDDDMMDKISSSPSIEDGGCYPVAAPVAWPRRVLSLPSSIRSSSPLVSGSSGARVCSPYPEPLKYLHSPNAMALPSRALPALPTPVQNHRLQGEYTDRDENDNDSDAESDEEDSWDTFNSTVEFHDHDEEETETQQHNITNKEEVRIRPSDDGG